MKFNIFLFAFLICIGFISICDAQTSSIPQIIAFQGFLSTGDSAFNSPPGGVPATMNLYLDAAGTSQVWSHTYPNVSVKNGYYTVLMDFSHDWQNGSADFSKQYWLRANIASQLMDPPVQLTTSPYTFNARIADSAVSAKTAVHANAADNATRAASAALADNATRATLADNSKLADSATHIPPQAPVGTIMAYGGTAASLSLINAIGWYLCDGTGISASANPAYRDAVGATWGSSGGGTTLYLPNLQGVFLRGVNGNRSDTLADPDVSRGVGSVQRDAFQGHYHNIGVAPNNPGGLQAIQALSSQIYGVGPFRTNEFSANRASTPVTDSPDMTGASVGPSGLPRFTTETRPKNAAIYWIIKVK